MDEDRLLLSVPGRLCLLGEHSDWASEYINDNRSIEPGAAIVCLVNLKMTATVRCHKNFHFSTLRDNKRVDLECAMDKEHLQDIVNHDKFFSYVASTALLMMEKYKVKGIEIDIIENDLPLCKGLSSSAAVCVLTARAYNKVYDLGMSVKEEIDAAYWGERNTYSMCGKMDHVCAYDHLVYRMDFLPSEVEVTEIKLKKSMYIVWSDLKAYKDTKTILRDLNACYPSANSKIARDVHQALGKDNQKIIRRATKAIESGNLELLGKLMTKSQKIFSKKVVPASNALIAPRLYQSLNDPNIESMIYGGKGVGSQGDGSVQFLAKDAEKQKQLVNYLNSMPHLYHAVPISLKV